MIKIAFGADHAGFELKKKLAAAAAEAGREIIDCGTDSDVSCDYPDFAVKAASEVSGGRADFGVLVCGSGVGMSIAANKLAGVRAALACSPEHARLARLHNDANVLCLGASFTDEKTAVESMKIFVSTEFEGGRHALRVAKIKSLEKISQKNELS